MSLLAKNTNQYRILIEELHPTNEKSGNQLEFSLEDREDLFKVVTALNKVEGLDEQVATRLGVALRLLGPVLIDNRKHNLFAEFMPHFKNFMHNLKKTVKQSDM